ncbi:hypothetical protein [Trichocoleus sp. FACHB-832]|uniref:hypothetical protein n=1 Tax=Trichocoleus sp. FACHB-832 TaxID=2692875 RepID=UPI0016872171|nr:hypothetical protein [Trichocoleus sp. FACHB-832]
MRKNLWDLRNSLITDMVKELYQFDIVQERARARSRMIRQFKVTMASTGVFGID